MALETLSAIALAGNVLQFLEFGQKLLSQAREIHKSADGLTAEVADIKQVAAGLSDLSAALIIPSGANLGFMEESIRESAQKCREIADELLRCLRRFGTPNQHHGRWKSARQTIAVLWHKEKIEDLLKKMERVRKQLDTAVLAHIRYAVHNAHPQYS